MKGRRFTAEQIIGVLKEAEAGAKTKELCRRHGISGTTFFDWKAKYGGMTVSEARRLRELEHENSRLKKLAGPKMVSPQAKRQAVEVLMGERAFGITRACVHASRRSPR